jgi:ankyrin repeat protein
MSYVLKGIFEEHPHAKDVYEECLKGDADSISNILNWYPHIIDERDAEGRTLLMFAARFGFYNCARLLLQNGANTEVVDCAGHTALMLACVDNRMDIVILLLEHGAEVETMSNSGNTPLMFASNSGLAELSALLLDRGAAIDIRNRTGDTALAIAVKSNHLEVAEVLIAHDAFLGYKNYRSCHKGTMRTGQTIIDLVQSEQMRVLLEEAGQAGESTFIMK